MQQSASSLKNILLIDDDMDDSFFLSHALAKISNEFTLYNLSSEDRLVEMIESCKPFLIIIDYHLFKKGGLECLRKIKQHRVFKDVQVMMWSSSLSRADVVLAMKEGAMDFYQKPSSIQALVKKMEEVLWYCSRISTLHFSNLQ